MRSLVSSLPGREIIEAIGHAVILQDRNFRIIYQNKMAKKLIGSHRGEFCYRALHQNNAVCVRCPLVLSFKDGRVHRIERPGSHKRGSVVEVTSSVIKGSDGNIIAGMEVVRDIARLKKREEEQERLMGELKEAVNRAKTPKVLVPICASCNKIRDDKNRWTKVDDYIRVHYEAELTHGYCPDCLKKAFHFDD